jgi:hypothetical protein
MLSARRASCLAIQLSAGRQVKPDSALAHPSRYFARVAHYKRVIRYIFGNHRSCSDKDISSYYMAADYSGVGADACTTFDESLFIFIPPHDRAAGIDHVGKDHGRATKDIILQNNPGVDRDIILDLHVRAYSNARRDEYILAYVAALTDKAVFHHVTEMPYFRSGANTAGLVDVAGFMDENIRSLYCHTNQTSSTLTGIPPCSKDRCAAVRTRSTSSPFIPSVRGRDW